MILDIVVMAILGFIIGYPIVLCAFILDDIREGGVDDDETYKN